MKIRHKAKIKKIFIDNAAGAPIDLRVEKEMLRAFKIKGNPSAFNEFGRMSAKELSNARLKIARFLGAHQEEIVFTGSGSEANNLAIRGIANSLQFTVYSLQKNSKDQKIKPHIITTQIEHPSVLEPMKQLERYGFRVTYLPVDTEGFIDLKDLEKCLCKDTVLVSVMYANNEIGTIQPINKIGRIIKEFKTKNLKLNILNYPLFHVDACQATGYLNMNMNTLQADLVTFNGSKIGGPRGIGCLYVKRGIVVEPLVFGGGQERGLRAGTENLPAILGLAKAVEIIDQKEKVKLSILRDYFIAEIQKIDGGIRVNGSSGISRLPNNINISIPFLDSENLLLELDKYGISAGSGSACTSRSVEPSHVLKAIGVEKKYLTGAIRFSMGKQTTKKDVDYILKVLPKVIRDLKKRYEK